MDVAELVQKNALRRALNDDEPSVREALKGQVAGKWTGAMHVEVNALSDMRCWDLLPRIQRKPLLLTKFVLLPRWDEHDMVSGHKARLAVCGNEE